MSRRVGLKVPKYAFIKFACDGKTLQAKTKDLWCDHAVTVGRDVMAPWENEFLKATVLGLSDDPTVLMEIERNYMKSLNPPRSTRPDITKRPTVRKPLRRPPVMPVRKTLRLSDRTKTSQKRKATEDIVFLPNRRPKPVTSRPHHPRHAFQFDRMTDESAAEVRRIVEEARSAGCSYSNPCTTTASSTTLTLLNMDTQQITTTCNSPTFTPTRNTPPLSPTILPLSPTVHVATPPFSPTVRNPPLSPTVHVANPPLSPTGPIPHLYPTVPNLPLSPTLPNPPFSPPVQNPPLSPTVHVAYPPLSPTGPNLPLSPTLSNPPFSPTVHVAYQPLSPTGPNLLLSPTLSNPPFSPTVHVANPPLSPTGPNLPLSPILSNPPFSPTVHVANPPLSPTGPNLTLSPTLPNPPFSPTLSNPCDSPLRLFLPMSSPPTPCSVTSQPALDRGFRPCEDLSPPDDIIGMFQQMMSYIKRLESKVDLLMSKPCDCRCSAPQEAAPVSDAAPPQQTETAATVPPPPPPSSPPPIPQFEDRRIWNLRPSQLGGDKVTPELLSSLISQLPASQDCTDEGLNLEGDVLTRILAKSTSSLNLAKNLLFEGFTLHELYGRNANGKNFGGARKLPLNPLKVRKIVDILGLHYREDNLEKKAVTAINAALRYLWNVRLSHPWLPLEELHM